MRITQIILLVILTAWAYTMTYHVAVNKPDSDRQEALIMSRDALLSFNNPYNLRTSQDNPVTTGLFSMVISIPFDNIKHLTFIFGLGMFIIFYRGKHFILFGIFMVLFVPVSRTMYYQLTEIYYIMPVLYLTRQWWLIAIWRNPLALFDLSGKHFNIPALLLDYCLLQLFAIML